MGNHEKYAKALDYTEQAAGRVGIPFLRGRAQALRFGSATLNLAGVDYQAKREPYLEGAERLMAAGSGERAAVAQSGRLSSGGPSRL